MKTERIALILLAVTLIAVVWSDKLDAQDATLKDKYSTTFETIYADQIILRDKDGNKAWILPHQISVSDSDKRYAVMRPNGIQLWKRSEGSGNEGPQVEISCGDNHAMVAARTDPAAAATAWLYADTSRASIELFEATEPRVPSPLRYSFKETTR